MQPTVDQAFHDESRDRPTALAQVSDALASASTLMPAELLERVCEAVKAHLSLAHAVLFKRVAGQSRTVVWSAAGVPAASRMAAREQAWIRAAELLDGGAPSHRALGQVASASVWEERLGLSAMLYVESSRALDGEDRLLLSVLLRRMLCLPNHDE